MGSAGLTFEAGSWCGALLLAVVRGGGQRGEQKRKVGVAGGMERWERMCGICLHHNVKNAAYRREMSEEKNWAPGFE